MAFSMAVKTKSLIIRHLPVFMCVRGKCKVAKTRSNVVESGAKDYVYFLHNHKVPLHSFEEAISVLKAYSFEEDKETVTMCMECRGIDKVIPAFRGTLMLPIPFGINKKVLVFAEGKQAEQAMHAGADIVGGPEIIPQVENHELEFDHCLASYEMAEKIKHLQRVLREKMPHTRRGSITDNLSEAIQTFKHTRVYKTDKYGYVNTAIGMLNFKRQDLQQNANTIINAVLTHRRIQKGEFIRKISLTSTFGPGLRLTHTELVPSTKSRTIL